MWLILLLVLLLLVYLLFVLKLKIKIKTFFRKGFAPKRGNFGVYCYCGKQGKGKTYSVVEFLKEHKNKKIYSNVHITGIDYIYYNGFEQLLNIEDNDCIIFYDEIFSALTKSTKINNDVLSFLSQMRKRHVIFLTTAQEWLEINITLRRYCRYQIECNMINFMGVGLLFKHFYDAEQMRWSPLDNEYIAPLCSFTLSKCNIATANMYDTNERIKSF